MAIEVTIPRLGWSMETGTFGEWLKQDGDFVAAGEPVFALESDKALQEVESIDEGILHIVQPGPGPGDTVEVGRVIGYLLAEGETAPSPPPVMEVTPAKTKPMSEGRVEIGITTGPAPVQAVRTHVAASPAVRRLAAELGVDWRALPVRGTVSKNDILLAAGRQGSAVQPTNPPRAESVPRRRARAGLPRISPRAARAAQTFQLDWTGLQGTGSRGRIRERDVLAAASGQGLRPEPAEVDPRSGTWQPATKVRRTTAMRLLASAQQTAPVTLTTKVDASALVIVREAFKAQGAAPVPTYNDLLLKLVAGSLRECPALNASWRDDGLFVYDQVNLAIAVESDHGLVAPVVEDADQRSLEEIVQQTRALVEQARAGNLRSSQLQSGTFTVTNLGMLGIDHFTPIINLPQTAILGIGRVVAEPVVKNGEVVAGQTMALSLTFDHRAIDGAPAARWLQLLSERIREPATHIR